jgi:uncharacterized protein (DUF305 family)
MTTRFPRTTAAVLVAIAAVAACSHATQAPGNGAMKFESPAEQARADGGIPAFTEADVHFMTGMIAHHSQAVLMAGWAKSHGASDGLQRLCERIAVGQTDEIHLMQAWLRKRGQPVPDGDPAHATMMPGMDHPMLMPGMLTAAQLAELDRARGVDFDRLFLTYMIMHHQGAITMVSDLFASYGAAQDDMIFKFASDVNVDQTTEIDRMNLMLAALPSGGQDR